jgi:hypothetical protein
MTSVPHSYLCPRGVWSRWSSFGLACLCFGRRRCMSRCGCASTFRLLGRSHAAVPHRPPQSNMGSCCKSRCACFRHGAPRQEFENHRIVAWRPVKRMVFVDSIRHVSLGTYDRIRQGLEYTCSVYESNGELNNIHCLFAPTKIV